MGREGSPCGWIVKGLGVLSWINGNSQSKFCEIVAQAVGYNQQVGLLCLPFVCFSTPQPPLCRSLSRNSVVQNDQGNKIKTCKKSVIPVNATKFGEISKLYCALPAAQLNKNIKKQHRKALTGIFNAHHAYFLK
jgi:hypothetical protein